MKRDRRFRSHIKLSEDKDGQIYLADLLWRTCLENNCHLKDFRKVLSEAQSDKLALTVSRLLYRFGNETGYKVAPRTGVARYHWKCAKPYGTIPAYTKIKEIIKIAAQPTPAGVIISKPIFNMVV